MNKADAGIEEEEAGIAKPSWSAAVLRRSWWIGKRLAVAGAAISSAPVVIPPLFVLSTLGLAFSFPFGICLVGYVCTDKFMSVLLPLPPLMEGGFDAGRGDETVLEEEKWEKGGILEGEREKSVEEEKCLELRNDAATVEELKKCDFAIPAREFGVGAQQKEQLGEDVEASFESRGSPKSPYTVVVMAASEASEKIDYEPPNLSLEHLSIVELGGEEKVSDSSVMEEQRKDCGEEEQRVGVASGVVTEGKELSEEGSTGVPRLKSEHVLSAVIVPSKDENAEILENVGSMKHRSLGKPVSAPAAAVDVTHSRSHDEISCLQRAQNEEQLWDQIFLMRAIVGYTATLQPSLGEELMALFLMIGVEPPVSLKEAIDLVEISNRLQFLKSVVGVK